MDTNPTLQTIAARRSVRRYTGEQVPEEALARILRAGQQAPSGGNCQYNHFFVLQSGPALARLIDLAADAFAAMTYGEDTYKSLRHSIDAAKKGGYVFTLGAPTLVVACNRAAHGNAMADAAVALQNMMLAATSLDIGSCWVNQLRWLRDDAPIRAALLSYGMRTDETVYGALALGIAQAATHNAPPLTGNTITRVR